MNRSLLKIYKWRIDHISSQNFMVIASMLVGVVSGIAAVILKSAVHFVQGLLQFNFDIQYANQLYIIYPLIGILLTVVYVQFFRGGKLGRGITNILYSISKRNGNVERDKMYSHIISSALTVGFGGSAGLEAPIVVTGSAIGSNTAKWLHLSAKERTLLLGCGVAGGIAAIFNSPIAGVIFALEVILTDLAISAFIPLLIASASATVVSKVLYDRHIFYLITDGWDVHAIPYYVLLGIFCGLLSAYVTRMTITIEARFGRNSEVNIFLRALMGGVIIGLLVFLLPPLYGEGYETVEYLLGGQVQRLLDNSLFFGFNESPWFILLFVGVVMMVKVIATAVTIAAGGNGGIFAPSLFIGALAGYFFAFIFNQLGIATLNESNFVAVGMAGLLSGVIHAPLTGIFLIAEITGGYVLFVPLMIVSALSYFITRFFEPYSVYTRTLVQQGVWMEDSKDVTVLNRMQLEHLIERDFVPVHIGDTLRDLVKVIAKCKRNIFPVLDRDNKLVGIILLNSIRELMFDSTKYDDLTVDELMTPPPGVVDLNEPMQSVMKKFERLNAWNLPVVEEGRYIGFVSKSNIFTQYRMKLIRHTKKLG